MGSQFRTSSANGSVVVTYSDDGSTTTKPAAPTFSPEAGTYSTAQSVTISGPTGASIYYTTNGDDPTTSSTEYSSAIDVSTTTTLKAIAVVDGVSSDVAEATYTINSGSTTTDEKTYVKVTSDDQLVSDNKYLIVYENGTSSVALSAKSSSSTSRGSGADVEINSNTITTEVNISGKPYEITLGGSSSDGWTLYDATTGSYLGYTGSSNTLNYGSSSTATGYTWNIDYSTPYIQNAYYTTRYLRYNYNSGADYFAAYTSTNNISNVALYVLQDESAVTRPSITPVTGSYTTDQTVTITNNYEGATVYYTTDGSEPSSTNGTALTSTANGATATFTASTTTTVKAVAVAEVDGETVSSSVVTSVITITHKVGNPTVTSDGAKVTMTATQADGEAATRYIYYTTGNTLVLNSDGSLASSAVQYTAPVALARTTKFHVVAVDADGCTSDTVAYTFTPTVVTLPYNETFQSSSQEATLGDFTADPTSSANSTPYWRINKNSGSDAITKYGEERQYAYVTGTSSSSISGSADLISPIMDVNGYQTVEINFSHAGHYFALARTSGTVTPTDDDYCADDYCKMYYCEVTKNSDGSFEDGTWHELKIPTWFTEETKYIDDKSGYVGQFPRINAGNIDFPGNVGINSENYAVPTTGYMRIKFTFTKPNSTTYYGTWNIIQFYARGTKTETEDISYEDASISTGGLYTYVTKNPIDWNKTLNNNTKVTNGIRAYKVVKFNKTKALLVQLGNHANNNSNDDANLNSEDITVAETPVVLQGASGGTYLVIAQSDDQPSKAVGNKLIAAAANGTTPTATQSLYALKKKAGATEDENLSNYIWRKLKTTQTVPYGKAYLNGEDMTTEEITEQTNAKKGIYASFDDLQNATTGIVEVPTEEHKSTDGYFYNLQGMRVAHPAHGIYIYNGRKIIIK